MTITVYSKPACVQCVATKTWLRARGIPFVEIDVTQDEAAFAQAAATGIRQMPIVVADGCEPFGGFDPDRLALAEIAQEVETRPVEREVKGAGHGDSGQAENAATGENNHGGQ